MAPSLFHTKPNPNMAYPTRANLTRTGPTIPRLAITQSITPLRTKPHLSTPCLARPNPISPVHIPIKLLACRTL